jgi:hypothetical protein
VKAHKQRFVIDVYLAPSLSNPTLHFEHELSPPSPLIFTWFKDPLPFLSNAVHGGCQSALGGLPDQSLATFAPRRRPGFYRVLRSMRFRRYNPLKWNPTHPPMMSPTTADVSVLGSGRENSYHGVGKPGKTFVGCKHHDRPNEYHTQHRSQHLRWGELAKVKVTYK